MNKIKSILKAFTFRFKDCTSLLNRNIICSISYVGILVLILSYFYHFKFLEYYSTYDIIEFFLKEFFKEFIVSILFLIILSWNMYIVSKPICDKNNFDMKFKNIFNLYTHMYTILFALDIFFIIVFKDLKINNNIQTIYTLSSIVVAILSTVLYPLFFLNYLSKKDIKIISPSSKRNSFIKRFESNRFLILINKITQNISNILLLKNEYYINIVGCKNICNHFISFVCMSIFLTILKLKINPNVINYDIDFSLKSYTTMELLINYLSETILLILGTVILSLIYWSYIKSKHFSHNKLSYTFKITLVSVYVIMLVNIGELFQRKVINFSTISPSILPSQLMGVVITFLTYISIIYIVFFFIKKILLKSYKIQNQKIK